MAEAWCGLSACALQTGDPVRAAAALHAALSRAALSAAARALAGPVAAAAGAPGWCGLSGDGLVVASAPGLAMALDGATVSRRLPAGWAAARILAVTRDGAHVLGSPVDVGAVTRLEAFVEVVAGRLDGWAWHPGDPGRRPRLTLAAGGETRPLPCGAPVDGIGGLRPLARPYRLTAGLPGGPVEIRGPDGRHVLGSPVDPGLFARMAADAARAIAGGPGGPAPIWAGVAPVRTQAGASPRRAVDVVIPVYGHAGLTLACLDTVRATVPSGTSIIVVDDASSDPALVAALDRLARERHIHLLRHAENQGFPAAANTGLRVHPDRDAVLLNSDTTVPPTWLERLREAAYAAPDIGTATPLSNDATILTYRAPGWPAAALDRLAQQANGSAVVDIPTGIGFCLYLRRDCLNETGLFRPELFAQGYGEENDLCLRARALGWRSVAATGVFVAHVGGASFGAARAHLMRRNAALLNRLHPGHDDLVAEWVARDPLGSARRRMDALRWRTGQRAGSVVLVTHDEGGGVDRVIAARCAAIAAEGLRPVVLRPTERGCRVHEGVADGHPALVYRLPAELPALAALLRRDRPRHVELHHMLGHDHAITRLADLLGVPYEAFIHDYASFCQRISLVGAQRRYCGEPPIPGCVACIADLGSLLDDTPVREHVSRSAAGLVGARRVVVPSHDVAARLHRHFAGVVPEVVAWENEPAAAPRAKRPGARRICVVGAIGMEKGYDVLLACVRDARARSLPLSFVVAGYSSDDERLLDAGPVEITGGFEPGEAVRLIAAQRAHLAFIPSIWPETWCFALSDAWSAGLDAAAFDIGAPAERIRRTGRGWVLPLGLSAQAVNDALLTCSAMT